MNDPPARTEAEAIAQHAARVQVYISREEQPHCAHPGTCPDCPYRVRRAQR
jgi:hypothetical protein